MSTELFYRWDSRPFHQGQQIPPGNWGNWTFTLGPENSPHFYREYAFEQIRAAEFPAMPSRLTANFAYVEYADAMRWADEEDRALYLVELPAGATSARLDMAYVSLMKGCHDFACLQTFIRSYWSGHQSAQSVMELLTQSALTVRNVLRPVVVPT